MRIYGTIIAVFQILRGINIKKKLNEEKDTDSSIDLGVINEEV
jgi:hypothetical protein